MIKRFLALLCVLSIVAMLLVPALGVVASAASESADRVVLDYRSFVSGRQSIDGGDILSVSVPAKYCSVYMKTLDGISFVQGGVTGTVGFSYQNGCYAQMKMFIPGGTFSSPDYFMLRDIDDGTPLHLISKFFISPSFKGNYDVRVFYKVHYYNEAFTEIAVSPDANLVSFNNCSGRFDGLFETDQSADNAFDIPVGAKYFTICLALRVAHISLSETVESGSEDLSIDFGFSDCTFDVTRYNVPFDIGSFFSIFGSVGDWTVNQIGEFGSVFWNAEAGSLTFLGVLGVAGLALAVVILIVFVVSRSIRYHG